MSEEKVLTKEIAEQYVADNKEEIKNEIYLPDYTSIDEAAADFLANIQTSGELNLDGLSEISDATAESLSNFQGTTLYLNGLTQLSFSSKMSFSKYRGYLYVKGLGEKDFHAADPDWVCDRLDG